MEGTHQLLHDTGRCAVSCVKTRKNLYNTFMAALITGSIFGDRILCFRARIVGCRV